MLAVFHKPIFFFFWENLEMSLNSKFCHQRFARIFMCVLQKPDAACGQMWVTAVEQKCMFHLCHYFLQNVHALLNVSVLLVLQADSTMALSETQIDGNEKDRAMGEGTQNTSFWLASSYGHTSATFSDVCMFSAWNLKFTYTFECIHSPSPVVWVSRR